MKTKHYATLFLIFSCFSTFGYTSKPPKQNTLTYSTREQNGRIIPIALFCLDRYTTTKEVISACTNLAQQNVQLSFDELAVGRSLFGVVGRERIRKVAGKITLPNGHSEAFAAGGLMSFRLLRIQFSVEGDSANQRIEMIEVID